jgi:threonine/homoserine/homoserine lactone efflux protein
MPEPDALALVEQLRAANRRWKALAAGLGCLSLVLLLLLLIAGGLALTLSARVQYYRDLSGAR